MYCCTYAHVYRPTVHTVHIRMYKRVVCSHTYSATVLRKLLMVPMSFGKRTLSSGSVAVTKKNVFVVMRVNGPGEISTGSED